MHVFVGAHNVVMAAVQCSVTNASHKAPSFWQVITGGITGLLGWLFYLVGSLVWIVARAIFGLVFNFVNATVFSPLSLTGGPIGYAFNIAWIAMRDASGAVALAMLAWGVVRHNLSYISGKKVDRSEMAEGFMVWVAVVLGGTLFFTLLLTVADSVTVSMSHLAAVGAIQQLNCMPQEGALTGGLAIAGAGIVSMSLMPAALLVIAGILCWGVFVWLARLVDLVFYCSLLPVMAALSVGGDKKYFTWAFNEAMGAIFSQMAMAIAWWLAWLMFIQPTGPLSGIGTGIWSQFIHLGLLAVGLSLFARSPQLLQRITGHSSAGVVSLAMGVAAGSLMASGARSAFGASKMGVLSNKLKEGIAAKSASELEARGQDAGPTVGRGLATGLGAALHGDFKGAASKAKAAGLSSAGLKGSGSRFAAGAKDAARGVGQMATFGAGMVFAPGKTAGHFVARSSQRAAVRQDDLKTAQIGSVHQEYKQQALHNMGSAELAPYKAEVDAMSGAAVMAATSGMGAAEYEAAVAKNPSGVASVVEQGRADLMATRYADDRTAKHMGHDVERLRGPVEAMNRYERDFHDRLHHYTRSGGEPGRAEQIVTGRQFRPTSAEGYGPGAYGAPSPARTSAKGSFTPPKQR
ncbi:MAG: hypothetical protein ACYCRD_04845 [Leptospirillum sp.]